MRRLLHDFLTHSRPKPLSLVTLEGYRRIGHSYLAWSCAQHGRDATIGDWTRENANRYHASLVTARLKQTTRRRHIATLRSWGNWLVEQGHATANPWDAIKTPVNEELRQPCPTTEQVRALFDACDRLPNRTRGAMTKAALALLGLAGLRMCEMIAVRVEDLQIDQYPRRVRVNWGKGGKAGSVRLNALACKVLEDWLAVRPQTARPELIYLHGDLQGDRPYTRSAFALSLDTLKKIAKLEGADITAHALRRFAATSLAQMPGATIADVQAFLRQSDPSTTLRYIKGSMSKQGEFVEGILPSIPPPPAPQPQPPTDNRERGPVGKKRAGWRRT